MNAPSHLSELTRGTRRECEGIVIGADPADGERGGIYWFWHGWNGRAMIVWMIAVIFGLAFSSNPWFVGWGSAMLGGIDVGFAVAGVVAAVLYAVALKAFPEPANVYAPSDPRHEGAKPAPVYSKK